MSVYGRPEVHLQGVVAAISAQLLWFLMSSARSVLYGLSFGGSIRSPTFCAIAGVRAADVIVFSFLCGDASCGELGFHLSEPYMWIRWPVWW